MTTKQSKNVITSTLLAIVFCLIFSSCNNDNNNPYIPGTACYDFVTFVETSETGSVFTFQKSNDSELITLTSAERLNPEKVKPGSRIIIQYIPSGGQDVYQSGPITLYGIAQITNGKTDPMTMDEIRAWPSNRIKMHSISRSGNYIDVWLEANISNAPKRFVIVADQATVNDEYPQLYLIFESDNNVNIPRQVYGSFDLNPVWELNSCKGVQVHYQDVTGDEVVKFEKTSKVPIQPGGDIIE